jgi:hypothetical protein
MARVAPSAANRSSRSPKSTLTWSPGDDGAGLRDDGEIALARCRGVSEFLARLPDGRRVDERHVGGRVRHQDRIIKRLVSRLQIRQYQVFLQIVIEIGDLGVPARHLQRQPGHGRRQQTFETPGTALRLGERGPIVEARIAHQIVTGGVFRQRCSHFDWCAHLDCTILVASRYFTGTPRVKVVADGEGTWPDGAANPACGRRRGDRVKRREFITGLTYHRRSPGSAGVAVGV